MNKTDYDQLERVHTSVSAFGDRRDFSLSLSGTKQICERRGERERERERDSGVFSPVTGAFERFCSIFAFEFWLERYPLFIDLSCFDVAFFSHRLLLRGTRVFFERKEQSHLYC
jgi:hypothetical protein